MKTAPPAPCTASPMEKVRRTFRNHPIISVVACALLLSNLSDIATFAGAIATIILMVLPLLLIPSAVIALITRRRKRAAATIEAPEYGGTPYGYTPHDPLRYVYGEHDDATH